MCSFPYVAYYDRGRLYCQGEMGRTLRCATHHIRAAGCSTWLSRGASCPAPSRCLPNGILLLAAFFSGSPLEDIAYIDRIADNALNPDEVGYCGLAARDGAVGPPGAGSAG